jgi:UPF0755 protein
MRGHFVRLLIVATLGLAAAAGGWVAWAWISLHTPYAGWDGKSAVVVLEPGLDAGSVLERLAGAGVLRRPRLARMWLSWVGGAERIHAGEYRFERAASPVDVLGRLDRGDVVLHAVTLPEGLTFTEVAERLQREGFGPLEELIATFRDPSVIRDVDPEAQDLEGYLFPDTYHFPRGARPEEIRDTLVRRFRDVMGRAFLDSAGRSELGVRGSVTLASMIEKETSLASERRRISQVFHNRLQRGMRLECDPTVIYALKRAGRPVKRLTYADLRFDSPWNTYVVSGLPSGPIANPGRESLLAALDPIDGDELYFVAAPDGGHRFSESLDGHRRAVAEWRRHVRSSR